MDFNPLDAMLHVDQYLDILANQYGPWLYGILFLVIFCETGLVAMPFLPGDSLLFLVGALASRPDSLDIKVLIAVLFAAGILGDSTNYWIGRKFGLRLFQKTDSKIFRQSYLHNTQIFYDKHGGKTITIARFVPIIRTFAPFVAGIGRMNYSRFLAFSVLGNALWVGGLCTLGYHFGNLPFFKDNLSVMILAIIGISLLPMLIAWIKHRHPNHST